MICSQIALRTRYCTSPSRLTRLDDKIITLAHMRDTHHEHSLLQVCVGTTLIYTIRRDSPSCDIGGDQVDGRVDCRVCRVVFGSTNAGSEVGEN